MNGKGSGRRPAAVSDDAVTKNWERTFARDACQVCDGERGGTPGNENVVNGVIVCDYCHARGEVQP
jgi:hypothetical protein